MRRVIDFYFKFLLLALGLLTIGLLVPVGMQILARHGEIVPNYLSTEEFARFTFIWIVMIGSVVAVRDNSHFEIDILPTPKTQIGGLISIFIVRLPVLLFSMIFFWGGIEYTQFGSRMTSEWADINMALIYVSFPLAAAGWILFTAENMYDTIMRYRRSQPVIPAREF